MLQAIPVVSVEIQQSVIVPERLTSVFAKVAPPFFQRNLQILLDEKPSLKSDLEILEDYDRAECWMAQHGRAGFAVTPDRELINVFSRVAGEGLKAIESAKTNYDYLHLNCFEGRIEKLYLDAGFREVSREKNWFETPGNPLPAVVYMTWENK